MKLVKCLLISLCALMLATQTASARGRYTPGPETDDYRSKPIGAANIVWYCAYSSESLSIDCRLGKVSLGGAKPYASSIDHKLTKTALRILKDPEGTAGRTISIPLYSPPFEFDYARMLAEGVMCGSRVDCSVLFARNRGQLAELVTEFEGRSLLSDIGSVALASFEG